jgi:salicylate hydroxylase
VSQLPVMIAGAGLAGLATALGVANAGRHVVVLERSRMTNEAGAGIQLGPNAVTALQKLDAWDAVRPIVTMPPELHVRDGRTGHLLQTIDLGGEFIKRYGKPYCLALRADLHAALLSIARANPNIEIWDNCDVTEVADGETGVVINQTLNGQCLIAADGVHSRIRQLLFPTARTLSLRHTIFRSLEPLPDRLPGVMLENVNLWLCEDGHVVHYPAGKANLLNLVVVTDKLVKHPYSAFALVHEPLARILGAPKDYSIWPALAAPALSDWHRGNICLIGDAAHGTVPFLAQGAAMAIEDAAVLQDAFAKSATPELAFTQFTQNRIKRTIRLDRQSRRMTHIYHASGLIAAARNTVMRTKAINALQTVDWIYAYQAGRVELR